MEQVKNSSLANGEHHQNKGQSRRKVLNTIGEHCIIINMKGQFRDYTGYEIYDDGRVYSKTRKKFMTFKVMKDGYVRMELFKDHKPKIFNVHRMVAEIFIPNPENKPFVNHIDGNKRNNCVSNLEWCTQKENIAHAFRTGLSKVQPKNTGPLCKKVIQYDSEHNFIREFPSVIEITRSLGFQRCAIGKAIKTKKLYKNYYWEFSTTSND